MRNWVKIRRWTWELPQTLIGAAISLLHKEKPLRVIEYADQKVYLYNKFNGGISLGYYTHLDWNAKDHNDNNIREGLKKSILHEAKGHGTQSKWLGPFYLPLIGLPSVIHCAIHKMCGRKWNYYSFCTEKSADKIAKIKR
jgi:hypothetical protein